MGGREHHGAVIMLLRLLDVMRANLLVRPVLVRHRVEAVDGVITGIAVTTVVGTTRHTIHIRDSPFTGPTDTFGFCHFYSPFGLFSQFGYGFSK